MNLLDDDIDEYHDNKLDEFEENQFDGSTNTVAIDFSEENPVTINRNISDDKCNKNNVINGKPGCRKQNEVNIVRHYNRNPLNDDINIEDGEEVSDDLVAKLLDPFEQLEREFNWDNVAAIKPPTAFSSGQPSKKSLNMEAKVSHATMDINRKVYSR